MQTEYTSAERKPIIDEGLRFLLPPLSDEALEALRADILQNGCYSPIICMEDMTLVDGHNRHAILTGSPCTLDEQVTGLILKHGSCAGTTA